MRQGRRTRVFRGWCLRLQIGTASLERGHLSGDLKKIRKQAHVVGVFQAEGIVTGFDVETRLVCSTNGQEGKECKTVSERKWGQMGRAWLSKMGNPWRW